MQRNERGWSIRIGHDTDVDFCLWVLERDGLRVPPFDHHPDGDGTLRAAGLDAASWRRWIAQVVASRDELDALFGAEAHTALRGSTRLHERHLALLPAPLWDGGPEVGRLLAELAEEYRSVSTARTAGSERLPTPSEHRLADVLSPFRDAIPAPLRTIFVAYPGPIRTEFPPSAVVLAVSGWAPAAADLVAEIVSSAEALARSNERAPRRA